MKLFVKQKKSKTEMSWIFLLREASIIQNFYTLLVVEKVWRADKIFVRFYVSEGKGFV